MSKISTSKDSIIIAGEIFEQYLVFHFDRLNNKIGVFTTGGNVGVLEKDEVIKLIDWLNANKPISDRNN